MSGTLIFGALNDENLLINIFASNNCFNYRNIFQNGVDVLLKLDDAFLTKSCKFYIVLEKNSSNTKKYWFPKRSRLLNVYNVFYIIMFIHKIYLQESS